MKDIVTLRANWLQSFQGVRPWAEHSHAQSSAYNDPCPVQVVPPYNHKLSTSPMELQEWSGSRDPWLNTISHDYQQLKSLSKPEKKKTEDRHEVSKPVVNLITHS